MSQIIGGKLTTNSNPQPNVLEQDINEAQQEDQSQGSQQNLYNDSSRAQRVVIKPVVIPISGGMHDTGELVNPEYNLTQQQLQQANVQGGTSQFNIQQDDQEQVTDAIREIRQRHQQEIQHEVTIEAQDPQVIAMELVRDILQSENTTEFLLLSLQRCFIMKPIQVQQLLLNQNKLLLSIAQQGVPVGDFTKINFWLEYLSQELTFNKMLDLFTEAYNQNQDIDVVLIYGAIKSGLYSRNENTVKLCLRLLIKIIESLRERSPDGAHYDSRFSKWFNKILKQTEDSFVYNSVLQSIVECIEEHCNLVSDAAQLIMSVFKSDTFSLKQLPKMLKFVYPDDFFMVYESMNTLLASMKQKDADETEYALEQSSLIQEALIDATDSNGEIGLRLKCTNLLIEIWLLFPQIVSNPEKQQLGIGSLPLQDSFQYIFEQGVNEEDKVFRINIIAYGFLLLENLLQIQDFKSSQRVFETMTVGLLDHYKDKVSDKQIDQVSTEIILHGFNKVFKDHEGTIPKHDMLNPWLQQLILNLHQHKLGENLMTTSELEFLTDIIKLHGQTLQEDTAALLLEYFHAIQLSRPYLNHTMNLSVHIGQIVRLHKDSSMSIMRFVEQTIVPQTIEYFLSIKREEVAGIARRQRYRKGQVPGSKAQKKIQNQEKEQSADWRLKRYLSISLLDKLYQVMTGVKNQDNLVNQVRSAHRLYQEEFKTQSNGLTHLQQNWNHANHKNIGGVIALIDSTTKNGPDTNQRKIKGGQMDWIKVKQPSNPIALRAVEQYQAIKQKRIEKQNKERLEEAKKIQIQERWKSQSKQQVAKRGLILERDMSLRQRKVKQIFGGDERSQYQSLDTSSQSTTSLLLQPTSVLSQQISPNRGNKRSSSLALLKYSSAKKVKETGKALTARVSISSVAKKDQILIELNVEEDREKDSIRLALQRHENLFRYLFIKYAVNQTKVPSHPNQKISALRNKHLIEQIITTPELIKCFREHNMDHTMLNKHEFQLMITQINEKLLKSYEDDALNFSGFVQFFQQSAIYCHNQHRFKAPHETGGKNIKDLLYGEMITNLVTWFKVAAKTRGLLPIVYDYPELAHDPQKARLLKQLNQKIKQDSFYALPSGFVVSKEMHQVKEYGIPNAARKVLGESKTIAIELLDDFLTKALGIRLFQPVISLKETQAVKLTNHPDLQQNQQRSIENYNNNSSLLTVPTSSLLSAAPSENILNTPYKSAFGDKRLPTRQSGSSKRSFRTKNSSIISSTAPQGSTTLQSILQKNNQQQPMMLDDQDIYGLGITSNQNFHKKQNASQPQYLQSLQIYKTENILKIVEKNRLMEDLDDTVSILHHRAHQLAPNGTLMQKRSRRAFSKIQLEKRKLSKTNLEFENLLLQTKLSQDLKAATYEYQLSRKDESDLEPIRQTALCLEDMLQVVSGDLAQYPDSRKKATEALKAKYRQQAQTLLQLKTSQIKVNQRLGPGEVKSKLAIQKIEEQVKLEGQQKEDQDKRDKVRAKRDELLKKKIGRNYMISKDKPSQHSRARSQVMLGGGQGLINLKDLSQNANLDNIAVVDPRASELDQNKLKQLRAKQMLADAKRAGITIEDTQPKEKKPLLTKKVEDKAQKLAQIEASVERLTFIPPPKQTVVPDPKPVDEKVKADAIEQIKKQKAQIENQKMLIYTKKERQEVLAFYIRPEVQTILTEYAQKLGIMYDKAINAADKNDRILKRMTLDEYVQVFGLISGLIDQIFERRDLELIFDTIINERLETGQESQQDPTIASNIGSTISYEEFKKSFVRIASLCKVTLTKLRKEPEEKQEKMLDTTGGNSLTEWDEKGNQIWYYEGITIRKKIGNKVNKSSDKMYDISKLKPEKFLKVLHFISYESVRYFPPGKLTAKNSVELNKDIEPFDQTDLDNDDYGVPLEVRLAKAPFQADVPLEARLAKDPFQADVPLETRLAQAPFKADLSLEARLAKDPFQANVPLEAGLAQAPFQSDVPLEARLAKAPFQADVPLEARLAKEPFKAKVPALLPPVSIKAQSYHLSTPENEITRPAKKALNPLNSRKSTEQSVLFTPISRQNSNSGQKVDLPSDENYSFLQKITKVEPVKPKADLPDINTGKFKKPQADLPDLKSGKIKAKPLVTKDITIERNYVQNSVDLKTPEKIISDDEDKWDFSDTPKSPVASKNNKVKKSIIKEQPSILQQNLKIEPSEIEESYANDSFEEEEKNEAHPPLQQLGGIKNSVQDSIVDDDWLNEAASKKSSKKPISNIQNQVVVNNPFVDNGEIQDTYGSFKLEDDENW